LTVLDRGHIFTLDDTTNLGLETHVQHAISLIEDKVLDVLQRDTTSLYEIDQSTRSSNKQITATLDLSELRTNVCTTVNNARSDPRSVGKLSGLLKDLRDKLTGGSKNQRGGVGLSLTAELTGGISRHRRRTVDESLRKNGEEETTSLSGTSLGTSHQITTTHDNGDRVFLNRGGDLVVSKLDVAAQVLVQRRSRELVNRLRHLCTGSLDGDVVVLLEVDTSLLLGGIIDDAEELAFNAGVGRASDVLSVAPLAIAGTASSSTTTAASRVTIIAAAAVATTSTAPAAATIVTVAVGVLVGRDIVTPVGLTGSVVLVSPGTVADTVGSRRTAVHSGRTTWSRTGRRRASGRTTTLAAHVRRDVRSTTLLRTALLAAFVE
jgi:hypothetical protein